MKCSYAYAHSTQDVDKQVFVDMVMAAHGHGMGRCVHSSTSSERGTLTADQSFEEGEDVMFERKKINLLLTDVT